MMRFNQCVRPALASVCAVVLSFAASVSAYAACSDPAAPGVDWSHCDLRNADLTDTALTGVDLTGADLSGATLADGSVCAPGSIGGCLSGPHIMSGMGGLAYSN